MARRHSARVIEMVGEIWEACKDGKPMDAVMRQYFREKHGLSRSLSHVVKEQATRYVKWKGTLQNNEPNRKCFEEIDSIEELFENSPADFSEDMLRKCVPDWLGDAMDVPVDWLRTIQKQPRLWVRLRDAESFDRVDEALGGGMVRAADSGAFSSSSGSNDSGLISDWLASQTGEWKEICEYSGDTDLFRTDVFHAGDVEIQDLSSQIVSRVGSPNPGESWWDTCCGEGGKTLHLSGMMNNKGLLMATDRAAWRLQKLKRRAARSGIFNYQSKLWNGLHHKNPGGNNRYHGILIDAPCSGIGTWQKNPDGRWRTSMDSILEMADVQKKLIEKTWKSLKPGGKLVYAVCTMARAETSEISQWVEGNIPDLIPHPIPGLDSHALQLWPQDAESNGMYVCQWIRKKD